MVTVWRVLGGKRQGDEAPSSLSVPPSFALPPVLPSTWPCRQLGSLADLCSASRAPSRCRHVEGGFEGEAEATPRAVWTRHLLWVWGPRALGSDHLVPHFPPGTTASLRPFLMGCGVSLSRKVSAPHPRFGLGSEGSEHRGEGWTVCVEACVCACVPVCARTHWAQSLWLWGASAQTRDCMGSPLPPHAVPLTLPGQELLEGCDRVLGINAPCSPQPTVQHLVGPRSGFAGWGLDNKLSPVRAQTQPGLSPVATLCSRGQTPVTLLTREGLTGKSVGPSSPLCCFFKKWSFFRRCNSNGAEQAQMTTQPSSLRDARVDSAQKSVH